MWSVNAGGYVLMALVLVTGLIAGFLGSIPRLGRCEATLETEQHGEVRCIYRADHMQSRHFWMKKDLAGRSSVEWREEIS